ncbi:MULTISPECIES: MFS transporter [Pseudomonadota]|jgi:predicted MFS family arabinose efflux permease|uniref:MFS transporter n=5 Tax=Bacteria TaxID=2 RepID=A0A7Z1BE06_9BURK|nr:MULTISPECIES: MFS transporter [Pseudomonadota]UTP22367.1 MFS transporter [Burkholderia sp. FXe9]KKL30642.1 MFS transporter [Burkholderia contaminans LMG 23361]KKL36257.1 MFS transporter [Burkholderia contaminans LMG 23361]MBR8394934.1 MFS transporter [Burkholderia cenocepacia]MBR8473842.1 MFS transporter [Burkholderia cenocepacia]
MSTAHRTPTPTTVKSSNSTDRAESLATWALALAQLVSWGSVYYSFSLLVVPMEQTMGWSRTSTNAALSLGLLVSGFVAYPVGKWIDHGLGRRIMAIGSLIAAAMLLMWSATSSLTILFVAWIGLGLSMAATFYDPLFAVLTHRYPLRYKTKITLVTLVAGFASTVFIPVTQFLVDLAGWRLALVALAACNLIICLPIHVFAIRSSRIDPNAAQPSAERTAVDAAATRRALRTPTFWALALCFTTYYATFAALTFHLVPLMVERGVTNTVLDITMALIGPAQVIARAVWFAFDRKVTITTVGFIVVTLFPVSTVVLIVAGKSAALLWIFALCYGAANGMMTILRGTIVQQFLWTEGYGAISGMLSFPSNIAKGIAPIAAASIWGLTDGYVAVEWTVLLVSALSAVSFFIAAKCASARPSYR